MEPPLKQIDKGKGKSIGIQTNEPQDLPRKSINPPISKLDLDLEKARKKKDLANELEKVENEAQVVETRRKIQFIKSNFTFVSWPNLSTQTTTYVPTCGPVISN